MASTDLVTLARAKTFLDINDSSQDGKLAQLITEASEAIVKETEREFAPQAAGATRRFELRVSSHAHGLYVMDLSPYDARTITSVTLHPETTAPQLLTLDFHYIAEPVNKPSGVFTHLKFYPDVPLGTSTVAQRFGFAYVDVLGDWGWPAVPAVVQGVCIKVVAAWLRRDVGQFAPAQQDQGMAPVPAPGFDLPLFAKRALERYNRRPKVF
jgi:hypothetical protein